MPVLVHLCNMKQLCDFHTFCGKGGDFHIGWVDQTLAEWTLLALCT